MGITCVISEPLKRFLPMFYGNSILSGKDKDNISEDKDAKLNKEITFLQKKFPERVPVIVEKCPRCSLNDLAKKKFLVPAEITIEDFYYIIRRRISLHPAENLCLYIGKVKPGHGTHMIQLYKEFQAGDGILHVTYTSKLR